MCLSPNENWDRGKSILTHGEKSHYNIHDSSYSDKSENYENLNMLIKYKILENLKYHSLTDSMHEQAFDEYYQFKHAAKGEMLNASQREIYDEMENIPEINSSYYNITDSDRSFTSVSPFNLSPFEDIENMFGTSLEDNELNDNFNLDKIALSVNEISNNKLLQSPSYKNPLHEGWNSFAEERFLNIDETKFNIDNFSRKDTLDNTDIKLPTEIPAINYPNVVANNKVDNVNEGESFPLLQRSAYELNESKNSSVHPNAINKVNDLECASESSLEDFNKFYIDSNTRRNDNHLLNNNNCNINSLSNLSQNLEDTDEIYSKFLCNSDYKSSLDRKCKLRLEKPFPVKINSRKLLPQFHNLGDGKVNQCSNMSPPNKDSLIFINPELTISANREISLTEDEFNREFTVNNINDSSEFVDMKRFNRETYLRKILETDTVIGEGKTVQKQYSTAQEVPTTLKNEILNIDEPIHDSYFRIPSTLLSKQNNWSEIEDIILSNQKDKTVKMDTKLYSTMNNIYTNEAKGNISETNIQTCSNIQSPSTTDMTNILDPRFFSLDNVGYDGLSNFQTLRVQDEVPRDCIYDPDIYGAVANINKNILLQTEGIFQNTTSNQITAYNLNKNKINSCDLDNHEEHEKRELKINPAEHELTSEIKIGYNNELVSHCIDNKSPPDSRNISISQTLKKSEKSNTLNSLCTIVAEAENLLEALASTTDSLQQQTNDMIDLEKFSIEVPLHEQFLSSPTSSFKSLDNSTDYQQSKIKSTFKNDYDTDQNYKDSSTLSNERYNPSTELQSYHSCHATVSDKSKRKLKKEMQYTATPSNSSSQGKSFMMKQLEDLREKRERLNNIFKKYENYSKKVFNPSVDSENMKRSYLGENDQASCFKYSNISTLRSIDSRNWDYYLSNPPKQSECSSHYYNQHRDLKYKINRNLDKTTGYEDSMKANSRYYPIHLNSEFIDKSENDFLSLSCDAYSSLYDNEREECYSSLPIYNDFNDTCNCCVPLTHVSHHAYCGSPLLTPLPNERPTCHSTFCFVNSSCSHEHPCPKNPEKKTLQSYKSKSKQIRSKILSSFSNSESLNENLPPNSSYPHY